tara:strand:+ start:978 stop:2780 length:1803 start_codon:yes stop_codon:yes gene_type:complete
MKMTTLRDQSKPILYGLVVLFILAMGNFGNVFSSTNPNRGTSEFCDPNLFVACSDDGKISISVDNFNQRFNSNIDFWLNQVTFNSQFNAIDKQLDTLNAKGRVYNSLLNEQINNKFISELNLSPQKNYSDEMMNFIRNYPNFNSTYKLELESYNLFIVDSAFNQEQYEAAVNDGTIDDKINENFELNNPQQAQLLYTRGTTRWNNWVSTMKRQIASTRFNYILGATQSLSNLELEEQFILQNSSFDFDYLTFDLNSIDDIKISDEELNEYYNKVKDDINYDLKIDNKRTIEFVKWNSTNLDSEAKDSIKKLAKDFRRNARRNSFKSALESDNNYTIYRKVELSNDFSTSKSGLASQILDADSTETALYNLIGAGRAIINFAFNNDIGEIKLIDIESDRENDSIDDIGVFHIESEENDGYLTLEDSNVKERLTNELIFMKKIELAKDEFNSLIDNYNKYIKEEGYDNLTEDDLKDFDPLDQWINGEEGISDKLLLRNYVGSINDFTTSFININLRDLFSTEEKIKASLLTSNKGMNYDIFAVDNDNICIIRLNTSPENPSESDINEYKKSELDRLSNSRVNLFIQDQKETSNVKDNRSLVY